MIATPVSAQTIQELLSKTPTELKAMKATNEQQIKDLALQQRKIQGAINLKEAYATPTARPTPTP